MQQSNKRPGFVKWLKKIAVLLFLWIIIHMACISIDGIIGYKGNADVAIILGNHVFHDGTLSAWLQGRVDVALELYKAGRVKKIFASGGISENDDGNYPEGDAMKQYLVVHGVPAADVVADNKGSNTFLTAKNFITWNNTQHFQSAIAVSQFYHITRSKYIMRKLGFKQVFGDASEEYRWADWLATVREVPAFYKYLLVY